MIEFRGLTALALACVASALACSSSSSGSTPTKFACPSNAPTSPPQGCVSCVQANCNSEFSAAYGSGYASLNLGGGACGPSVSCAAACPCNDVMCLAKCVPSSDCTTATTAADMCQTQKCSSACTSTSSDGGSPTTTGPTGPCDMSSTGLCFTDGLTSSECTQTGGTPVSACPTSGVVGCCTMSTLKECYYAPLTASEGMMVCSMTMGTFSTGM